MVLGTSLLSSFIRDCIVINSSSRVGFLGRCGGNQSWKRSLVKTDRYHREMAWRPAFQAWFLIRMAHVGIDDPGTYGRLLLAVFCPFTQEHEEEHGQEEATASQKKMHHPETSNTHTFSSRQLLEGHHGDLPRAAVELVGRGPAHRGLGEDGGWNWEQVARFLCHQETNMSAWHANKSNSRKPTAITFSLMTKLFTTKKSSHVRTRQNKIPAQAVVEMLNRKENVDLHPNREKHMI